MLKQEIRMKNKPVTKIIIGIVAFATILGGVFLGQNLVNKGEEINIYLFYSEDDKQSRRARAFLDNYANNHEHVTLYTFDVWNDSNARETLETIRTKINTTDCAIPLVIVGDKGVIGYLSDGVSGAKIVDIIETCNSGCSQKIDEIKKVDFEREPSIAPIDRPKDENKEDDVC